MSLRHPRLPRLACASASRAPASVFVYRIRDVEMGRGASLEAGQMKHRPQTVAGHRERNHADEWSYATAHTGPQSVDTGSDAALEFGRTARWRVPGRAPACNRNAVGVHQAFHTVGVGLFKGH